METSRRGARLAIVCTALVAAASCPLAAPESPNAAPAPVWFSAAGDRLAYRAYGKGPPVIVVSGGPGLDADYMTPVAEDVAVQRYRAIVPELRGTGLSSAAGKNLAMMTVAGSVADLEALRQTLDAERVLLVGHSFGGAMVQAYAQAHPEHVAGRILVDTAGADLSSAPDAATADKWMERLTPQQKADYTAARAAGDASTAMRIRFRATITDPARADAFLAALKPIADPAAQARLSADYRANYHVTQRDPGFPVTIIYGENDWIRASQSQIVAAYPGCVVRLIPGAGHFSWIDRPDLFAGLMAEASKRN